MNDYKIVQFNAREGRTQHVRRPQDQLRQVKLTSSNREAAVRSRGNTVSNNQRHSGGSTQTGPQPSNNGAPSHVKRVFVVHKPNAEPNQMSNRGTTVRTNPKVQEQANGYSKPRLLSYQRPSVQQSAVRNPLTPAKTQALNGRKAASQTGLSARTRTSTTVRATRLSRRRGSKVSRPGQTMQVGTNKYRTSANYNQPYSRRQGAAQSNLRGTLVAQSFDDPIDPRYKQTVNYVIPKAYGSVIIKRLKPTNRRLPQQNNAPPQRRDPKRQSQRVSLTQRTRS